MALDVAIDIGTSRTRLATSAQGIIFDEPTLVAIDTNEGSVLSVGANALDFVGRSARPVIVYRPFAQGATIDFDVTARLLFGLFHRAGLSKMSRARVVMSVPTLATPIERRALRQAATQAGARDVTLIEAPLAAAIGLDLPIQEPLGSAVSVIGGGASEIAIISLGGIVTKDSRRVGGEDINRTIADAVRHQFGVVLSPEIIEVLKLNLSSVLGATNGKREVVPGRSVETGVPVEIEVDASLVNASVLSVMRANAEMMQECFRVTPPDLSQDVANLGVSLVGGVAGMRQAGEYLAGQTGVTTRVAESPDLVIIRGLQSCLEQMGQLHAMFRGQD
ncbi:MAG: rod shape-determining protein [Actinomycetota bacterium]